MSFGTDTDSMDGAALEPMRAWDEELWTVDDVAKFLRFSDRQVRSLVDVGTSAGGLPHIRIGRRIRFWPHEVRAWVQRHREAAS